MYVNASIVRYFTLILCHNIQEKAETSDAAYEKRHRKFETFEKRQRGREKEKLKHEHYKLKERIEQLRAMDSVAFMSLAASYFTPAPEGISSEIEELAGVGSPYTQVNGAVPHAEGERRRRKCWTMQSVSSSDIVTFFHQIAFGRLKISLKVHQELKWTVITRKNRTPRKRMSAHQKRIMPGPVPRHQPPLLFCPKNDSW
jgi:hypothetical protein